MGGSIGEVSAIALILGGFICWRKIITWEIPVSMLLTVVVFSGVFWVIDPEQC